MILARLVVAEGRLWSLDDKEWTRYVMARLWGSLVHHRHDRAAGATQ